MAQISRVELREILMGVDTPTFISMVTKTPVKMNQYLNYWIVDGEGKKKKNPNPTKNPYFDMGIENIKRQYKIVTGFDYENSVNNRREKEGKEKDFESKENWMEFISKGLVTDKSTGTKFYLRYQYQKDSKLEQEYLFNGNPILKQLFESYMSQRSEYENQGLDNPLQFQVVNLDNVMEISINKNKYELVD